MPASFQTLVFILLFTVLPSGCRKQAARANDRYKAHVIYHASRPLGCEEEKILATCSAQYKSGECYEFEVTGCDKTLVFKNITGQGWVHGSE